MEFTPEFLKRLDDEVQRAKSFTRQEAREHLKRAGILTSEGELAYPYQDDVSEASKKPKRRSAA